MERLRSWLSKKRSFRDVGAEVALTSGRVEEVDAGHGHAVPPVPSEQVDAASHHRHLAVAPRRRVGADVDPFRSRGVPLPHVAVPVSRADAKLTAQEVHRTAWGEKVRLGRSVSIRTW